MKKIEYPKEEIFNLRKEKFNLKNKVRSGQKENITPFRNAKKQLARVLTVFFMKRKNN